MSKKKRKKKNFPPVSEEMPVISQAGSGKQRRAGRYFKGHTDVSVEGTDVALCTVG